MTFTEFQESGFACDDLGRAIGDDWWHDEPQPGTGRLYCGGGLFIERRPLAGWSGRGLSKEWYLIIICEEWESDNLAELEQHLYEFAQAEGMA